MAEPSVIPVDTGVAGRQIPWSEEAEISVLSAMLIDGDAVAQAIEMVGDSSFYRESNRRVFRAMVRLYSRGEVNFGRLIATKVLAPAPLESSHVPCSPNACMSFPSQHFNSLSVALQF